MGFAQGKADESDWCKANTKSVQEALSRASGFDLIPANPKKAKIPVILMDRTINASEEWHLGRTGYAIGGSE